MKVTAERVFDASAGGKEPSEALFSSETADALRKAVGSLEEPAREIMIRRFFLEQKPSQIAKAMGLPIRKVGNIIYRTKGQLKNELKGYYE